MTINHMAITLFSAALASLLLTPLCVWMAVRHGLLDVPDPRKVHTRPIPRIGGLAIALATFAALAVAWLAGFAPVHVSIVPNAALAVLAAGSLVLAVGLLDDLRNIPARFKLLALFGAAVLVCSAGLRIEQFDLGASTLRLGLLAWPVTILWIVAVTVAVNFIDGLDGLAAGIVAIAVGGLAVVAAARGDAAMTLVAVALAGSLAGFLLFNYHPARIFMGDCGAQFVGFIVATAALLPERSGDVSAVVCLVGVALAVPLLDTLLTFVRRCILQRRSVFSAERGHIHHQLLDRGLGHRQVVLVLHGTTLATTACGVGLSLVDHWSALLAVPPAVTVVVLLFHASGAARMGEIWAAFQRNRRLAQAAAQERLVVEEMQLRFQRVSSFDEWWTVTCRAAGRLGFQRIALPLVRRDGSTRTLHWESNELPAGRVPVCVRLPVPQRRADNPDLHAEVEVLAAPSIECAGRKVAAFLRLISAYNPRGLASVQAMSEIDPADDRPSTNRAAVQIAASDHRAVLLKHR